MYALPLAIPLPTVAQCNTASLEDANSPSRPPRKSQASPAWKKAPRCRCTAADAQRSSASTAQSSSSSSGRVTPVPAMTCACVRACASASSE
jgi:hypothetical protein